VHAGGVQSKKAAQHARCVEDDHQGKFVVVVVAIARMYIFCRSGDHRTTFNLPLYRRPRQLIRSVAVVVAVLLWQVWLVLSRPNCAAHVVMAQPFLFFFPF
jgi:hypothetical protein